MEEGTVTSSDPPSPWTGGTVVGAVVVGLAVLALWKLWGRCCRQLQLKRVVEEEKTTLFRFLSDPANLKIIHPLTTEIRMKREAEEEGGVTLKEFDWVEKVPFTVVSAARMRCDPATFTITIDIVPAGGMHGVELKWWLKSNDPEPSDLSYERHLTHKPTVQQDPGQSTNDESAHSADDTRITTSGDKTDDRKTRVTRSADDKEARTVRNTSDKAPRCTEFHNEVRVTGPYVLVVCVILRIIRSTATKLSDRLQHHFKNPSE